MNLKDKNGEKLNIGDYFSYKDDYYKVIDCNNYTGYENFYDPVDKLNIKYITEHIIKVSYDEIPNFDL